MVKSKTICVNGNPKILGVVIETVVQKLGGSAGILLSPALLKGREIRVGTRAEIVESGTDLVITVRGYKAPTLNEMIAQSELSANKHPD